MANERFKAKVAALEELRAQLDAPATHPALRKALQDRNAFLVAKAAKIVAEAGLAELAPAVATAFDRLLDVAVEDPGCQAKDTIAKALRDLEHRDPAPFLRGLGHVQLEAVWGGKVDVAGPLRATCAQALVACDIDPARLLRELVDRFVDTDKWVRVDVARAIAQLGRPESALLLRLKTLCGDAEPEVLGQCLLSLLDLEPIESLAFVARFLDSADDDVRFEAAGALAQARSLEAIGYLERFWRGAVSIELRRATIAALAGSPHPEAAEFLLGLVAAGGDLAVAALAALASSRFRATTRDRAAALVASSDDASLERAFREHFSVPAR